jgi:hypothetical protein
VCVLFNPWPDRLGKTGPGHGVGKLKRGVLAICPQAVDVPFSNRGQTVWEKYVPGHGFGMLKGGLEAIRSLALGLPFSKRGQTVWENQDQVVILELFYAEKSSALATC